MARATVRGAEATPSRSVVQVLAVVTALLLALVACSSPSSTPRPAPGPIDPTATAADQPRRCVYSSHSVEQWRQFQNDVDDRVDCVLVFNDTATDWDGVVQPWFTRHGDDDMRWDRWVRSDQDHQLVIGQSFIPEGVPDDWRARGARGEYDDYMRQLGRNLVDAGLGRSVLRLAHEGNGDWFPHNIGTTPQERTDWAAYWARAAKILKATPGADFTLDWTVSAGSPYVPFDQWYPGDDAVDVVGADFYDRVLDDAPTGQPDRWAWQRSQPGGLDSVAGFAEARGKPLSVPEWGLAGPDEDGAGDAPEFIRDMTEFFAQRDVLYEGYWNKTDTPSDLRNNPRGLRAYRSVVAEEDR